MSESDPEETADGAETAAPAEGEPDVDALADLLGDRAIGRNDHVNAPGFVVSPDDV